MEERSSMALRERASRERTAQGMYLSDHAHSGVGSCWVVRPAGSTSTTSMQVGTSRGDTNDNVSHVYRVPECTTEHMVSRAICMLVGVCTCMACTWHVHTHVTVDRLGAAARPIDTTMATIHDAATTNNDSLVT